MVVDGTLGSGGDEDGSTYHAEAGSLSVGVVTLKKFLKLMDMRTSATVHGISYR